jgi:hypothetical protein
MKKIIAYIQVKIDKYVVKRFQKLMPKELIKSLYRAIADSELKITTKEIAVKKGRIKYTLLIIESIDGKRKYNLGRHFLKDSIVPC